MRDFKSWLDTFIPSIATYDYYVDFDKVYENADEYKIELNIMNSLIGSKNVAHDFEVLVTKYPEVLKCVPIILAKRELQIYAGDDNGRFHYDFEHMNYSIDQYKYFMEKTGLFELLANHIINNLVDYVLGVEVGFDTNGRKNRGGHLMEDLLEKYIVEAGYKKDVNYFKELKLSILEKMTGLDLSALSNKGKAEKRFDFVIINDKCVYAFECNFYNEGGSKLTETARSYKQLALEAKDIEGFKFVWVTDGIFGWKKHRRNLLETFEVLDTLYNIQDLKNGILKTF